MPNSVKKATVDAALWQLEKTAYCRLRDNGFHPNGVVDIGAHRGDWTT
jgi:hypothetical protein